MLFSDLLLPEHEAFVNQFPSVAQSAISFGEQFELDDDFVTGVAEEFTDYEFQPWLLPENQRGKLDVFQNLGMVVARNVLSIDLVEKYEKELAEMNIHPKSQATGLYLYEFSAINYGMPTLKPTEGSVSERLVRIYRNAFNGKMPIIVLNRYKRPNLIEGYEVRQTPHEDAVIEEPIIFGTGPGGTRIQPEASSESHDLRSDLENFEMSEKEGLIGEVSVGPYDIGVFAGKELMHYGFRFATTPDNAKPRRTIVLTSKNR